MRQNNEQRDGKRAKDSLDGGFIASPEPLQQWILVYMRIVYKDPAYVLLAGAAHHSSGAVNSRLW